ncbi:MAG: hypothetical protein Q9160_005476 [Pyrenula sp. 1 TL-2023]
MAETLLSEADGGPLPSSKQANDLWYDIIKLGLDSYPDNTAVIALHQPSNHLGRLIDSSSMVYEEPGRTYLSWTFRQLDTASQRLVSQLQAFGVKRGFTICTFIYSSVEWAIVLWATVKLGLLFTPLDPTVLRRGEEARYLLDLVKPAIVVVHTSGDAGDFDAIEASLSPKVKLIFDQQGQTPRNWFISGDTPDRDSVGHQATLVEPSSKNNGDEIAAIIFSSGTTGKPKGCTHSPRSLGAYILPPFPRSLTPTSKYLMHTSSHRIIHLSHSLGAWCVGASIVFPAPRFSPAATLQALLAEKCTHMQIVPNQLETLRRHPNFSPTAVKGVLDVLSIGGDIVSSNLLDRAHSVFEPRITCRMTYGMTEGAGVIDRLDVRERPPIVAGIVSAGRVMPGHRVRICDPNTPDPQRLRVVPLNTPGELHVSGPCLIRQYFPTDFPANSDKFINTATDDHGGGGGRRQWFLTGDRATMAPDGNITILGRYKDIIVRSGVKLSPAVIEICLSSDASVESAVAVGIPSPLHGEVPAGVVKLVAAGSSSGGVPMQDEDLERLKRRLVEKARTEIGEEAAPERVVVLAELGMERFPVNAESGKIAKDRLRERVVDMMKERAG